MPKVAMKDHEGGMGMFMFQLLFYCQPGLIESYPIWNHTSNAASGLIPYARKSLLQVVLEWVLGA